MKTANALVAALAGCAHLSSAQDWGTKGAWELLVPVGPDGGPPLAYRKPTSVAGCFVTAGNNTDGLTTVWAYDIFLNGWRIWPEVANPIADPCMLELGGVVLIIDEMNTNNIAFIDSAGARSRIGYPWTYPIVTGGPNTRAGQRFVSWGATIYSFSGVELATGVTHNDVWAIEGAALVAGAGTPQWVQVAVDGVTGIPPGRVGYSINAYGVSMVMYGGVSIDNTPGVLPQVCFSASTSAPCHFHQSVWLFRPGNPGVPETASITGTNWIRLGEAGANGGPVPAGRFDHSAAAMGDQLFVYGGSTAAGPSSELWAYNLVSQTWAQVAPSSPAPAISTDLGWGVGTGIGHHLYRFAQTVNPVSGEPLPGSGQLWRWAPAASAGGAAAPAAASAVLSSGASAAVAIGLLVGVANLALLVLLAAKAGAFAALPACQACGRRPAASFGSLNTSASAAGADGFYSPAPGGGAAPYAPPA